MQEAFAANVGAEEFERAVLEVSRRVPVLVDFWAPWCAPCRMLAPVLEKLGHEYAGKLALVKVNTDEEPELARAYGIRALPTVKVFRHGAVAGEFHGVQPESVIRSMLEQHLERASDRLLGEALEARALGDTATTLELLRRAHEDDPRNHRVQPELARALLEAGELDEVERVLRTLPPDRREDRDIRALSARLHVAREARDAPPISALERAIAHDPADCASRYRLAMRQALQGDHEAAMQQLLEVMRRDRGFGDDAARKALLAIFDTLEGRGPLVTRYRSLMAGLLH